WAGSGLVLGAGVMAGVVAAAEAPDRRGEEVVVIYNLAGGDDSARVARHYAEVRHVPDPQVIGLSLPTGETLTRANFDERLRRPLMKELVERGLVQVAGPEGRGTAGTPGQVSNVIQETAIRYLVLCYGVPLKIAPDPSLVRPGQEKLAAPMRRNEAAVDSELAGLAQIESGVPLAGPMTNPLAGATDPAQLHPRNGVFMVARLDGPTAEIAMGLVDKAVQAEEKGLWGRAWFDLRGLNGGGYQVGDDWIRAASEVARRAGYETVVDRAGPVFPEGFPMPQIALYAGWYAGSVSGPFKSATVEFMPGAVAYHLHSFSARTLKSTGTAWVGPLLERGVTATFGCVYEPYLKGTPNVGIFFDRLLDRGFTFGEAIYAAQGTLSWQTTVVGDPLYCPMLHSIEEFKVQLAG
ncbi:MAG: TIGR03790 family protein, partial [Verrucomicrobiae bacterium]|nr:TIGR03790 family protein [Verrucomicrobiae bacterium]